MIYNLHFHKNIMANIVPFVSLLFHWVSSNRSNITFVYLIVKVIAAFKSFFKFFFPFSQDRWRSFYCQKVLCSVYWLNKSLDGNPPLQTSILTRKWFSLTFFSHLTYYDTGFTFEFDRTSVLAKSTFQFLEKCEKFLVFQNLSVTLIRTKFNVWHEFGKLR